MYAGDAKMCALIWVGRGMVRGLAFFQRKIGPYLVVVTTAWNGVLRHASENMHTENRFDIEIDIKSESHT